MAQYLLVFGIIGWILLRLGLPASEIMLLLTYAIATGLVGHDLLRIRKGLPPRRTWRLYSGQEADIQEKAGKVAVEIFCMGILGVVGCLAGLFLVPEKWRWAFLLIFQVILLGWIMVRKRLSR